MLSNSGGKLLEILFVVKSLQQRKKKELQSLIYYSPPS